MSLGGNGNAEAIIEAERLKFTDNQFYYVLLGDLYMEIDNDKARAHFRNGPFFSSLP